MKFKFVIHPKDPKLSFLYKIGDIKKTNCRTIGTNWAISVKRTLIRQISKGNQYIKTNKFNNGSHEYNKKLLINADLKKRNTKSTNTKD